MEQMTELITSRQNPLVVETAKLSDRKHRARSGQFRFDGIKLAKEAILCGVPLTAVLLRASDAERLTQRLTQETGRDVSSCARVVLLADAVFDKISEESAPEGIICVARSMDALHTNITNVDELVIPAGERVVLLESVRDPSNLGAIIRSAAAFGVDRLIVSSDCVDIYNAKTVRASMGTLFSQPIVRVPSMPEAVGGLRRGGRRVFAAALDPTARKLGAFTVMSGDCVVIGNEGHGLAPETIAACDASVYIPMTARAESLNAAVAASVLMWAFRPTESK